MSNEQDYLEIIEARRKERERRYADEYRQRADMWLEAHSCHYEVRIDCACTCGNCGCCGGVK
jgi:hypothetical protein